MNHLDYTQEFVWEIKKLVHLFEEDLISIPLASDGICSVQLNLIVEHKGYAPFECTYKRLIEEDGRQELSYTDSSNLFLAHLFDEPWLNESAAPHTKPPLTPEGIGVSDEDLQAFDVFISDPEVNRLFILSLKKARCAKDVAEAVLRLVKKGVIGENTANRKCFAERILPFCAFSKGKSENNISNAIRNLLIEKHQDIKLSLQRLKQ